MIEGENEVQTQPISLVDISVQMFQRQGWDNKVSFLQQYIDKGQLVIANDTETPGGITYISTPGTEPGFALARGGKLLLQLEGDISQLARTGRSNSTVSSYTEHLYDDKERVSKSVHWSRADSGGFFITEETEFSYYDRGQTIERRRSKSGVGGEWTTEIKNYDENGRTIPPLKLL